MVTDKRYEIESMMSTELTIHSSARRVGKFNTVRHGTSTNTALKLAGRGLSKEVYSKKLSI
jgi:hypothetical protein